MATQPLNPQQMASELVALANQRGGPDNITVIILRIGEPSPLAHLLDESI
jgi:serine/threonine protein phosphatase PrpC